MKKIAILLSVLLVLSFTAVSANAPLYDMYYTDITACINQFNIPCFAVNGTSVVVIEDLPKYGFNVYAVSGTSPQQYQITLNPGAPITPVVFEIDINQVGTKAGTAQLNASYVYANGHFVNTFSMNGYTFVPIESLTPFGEVYWVPQQRALKLWVDGLPVSTTFTPVQVNAASKLYKETLDVVNIYLAAGNYDSALSALNWTLGYYSDGKICDANIDIDSPYYQILYEKREEIVYIVAMKNINIYVAAGNYAGASSYAYDQFYYYCDYDSPYGKILYDKAAEYDYTNTILNINTHMKNKDYHSAYVTLTNGFRGVGGNEYYDLLYSQYSRICNTWKSTNGCPIVVADYNIYEGDDGDNDLELKIINLTDKPIQAFRFSCEPQTIFGDIANSNYITFNGYASDDIYISGYDYGYIRWDFYRYPSARRLANLRITDVVFEDGTMWTAG